MSVDSSTDSGTPELPSPHMVPSPATPFSSSASASDPLVGKTVEGRYTVERRLARGGMATVYIAHDMRLDRKVAVKVMHPHLAEDEQFITRFDREARSAARISHPSVVSVSDQGIFDGRPFLVMDLIDGPNLRTLLRTQGTFSLDQALQYTSQILQALRAADREGVIHRDIKPENVMLPADGPVRVTDFGLAKAVSEATMSMTGNMLGTVTYMAPEIATTGVADCRTDLYSVGIMLYEMLTGFVPWHGDNAIHIAYSHVHDDVPSPSEEQPWIPREVDDFVAALTARRPEERLSSPAEALSMLDRVRAILPVETLRMRAAHAGGGSVASETAVYSSPLLAEEAAGSLAPTSVLPRVGSSGSAGEDGADIAASAGLGGGAVSDASGSADGSEAAFEDGAASETSAVSANHSDEADLEQTTTMPVMPAETIFPSARPKRTNKESETKQKPGGDSVLSRSTVASGTKPQRAKRGRLVTIIVIVVILLGASAAGGTWWWFEFGPGAYIELPITQNRPADEVRGELEKLGFKVEVSQEFSDTVPAGQVISSVPASASSAHKDSVITLLVSKGVDLRVVPNIIGKPREEAEGLITEVGLNVGKVEEVFSEEVPAGQVISQVQEPQASLRVDSTVDFTVSKGREPRKVPELVGKTKDEVAALLTPLVLVAEYTEAFSDEVPAGTVISQQTAAGTDLFRNDKVLLTVSKGPELVAVPEISGMSRRQAIEALESAGFHVEVNDLLGGIFGTAHSTDPRGGTMLKKGSTVTLTVV